MPNSNLPAQSRFRKLVEDISDLYLNARKAQVQFAWETGRRIVQEEQNGAMRAQYGAALIDQVSNELTDKFGPGFSANVLRNMRQFYLLNRIQPPAVKLDWTDYVELLPVKDEKTRRLLERRVIEEDLDSKQLRQLVQKVRGDSVRRSPGSAREENGATRSLLTPKRGMLYTYRIVQRPTLGEGARAEPVQLDLGFGMYKDLTSREAGRLGADQIVESLYDPADESYSLRSSQRTAKDLFTYQALIERVIDADTLKVRIDLGFGLKHRETLRLRDLDAPEVGTKAGDAAKAFVQSLLKEADSIILHTTRSDKYDRYLADVFIGEDTFLNNLLLEKEFASRF